MYIDFHKYNYSLVEQSAQDRYIERDKEAYKNVLRNWLEENIDEIINRKWEIDEIGFLQEISDFIKLIREGEALFELGFYTSCIALIGVSAEDFSKYLSLKLGRIDHIQTTNSKGRTLDVSQNNRLAYQLADSILTQAQYDLLDDIRVRRNDCLHYNQHFKLKSEGDLKVDAIKCLNNLKFVLKDILGISNSSVEHKEIIENLIKTVGVDSKNQDDMRLKVRNAISYLFNFPIAFDPNQKLVIKDDYFLVKEIDVDSNEITLAAILNAAGTFVIVELNEQVKNIIQQKGIKENDTIYATLVSQLTSLGMTAEWNFLEISKIDNFSEVFHQLHAEFWNDKSGEEE